MLAIIAVFQDGFFKPVPIVLVPAIDKETPSGDGPEGV